MAFGLVHIDPPRPPGRAHFIYAKEPCADDSERRDPPSRGSRSTGRTGQPPGGGATADFRLSASTTP